MGVPPVRPHPSSDGSFLDDRLLVLLLPTQPYRRCAPTIRKYIERLKRQTDAAHTKKDARMGIMRMLIAT